jgi:hypothetical protein
MPGTAAGCCVRDGWWELAKAPAIPGKPNTVMAGDADPFGRNIDTGVNPLGTPEKLPPQPAVRAETDGAVKPWKNFGEMRRLFEQLREQVGETRYLAEMELAGVQNPGQFQSASKALDCYERLARIAAQPEVA